MLYNVSYSQIQIGLSLNGSAATNRFGSKIVISENGTYIAVGSPNDDTNGYNTGKINVYKNVSGTWISYGSAIAGPNQSSSVAGSTTVFSGTFGGSGMSISEDGQTLAVGSTSNSTTGNFSGQVRIYRYINSDWLQIGASINGVNLGESLGSNVSLSADGNTIIIGSPSYDNAFQNIGVIRVFKFANNAWSLFGQQLQGFEVDQFFGIRTAISDDGNIIAVSCPFLTVSGQNLGGVKLYKNINGNWSPYGNTIYGDSNGENFSFAIDLAADGNTIAIGASLAKLSTIRPGAVRVFTISNAVWSQQVNTINGEAPDDYFGEELSLSDDGTVLAVGSLYSDISGIDSGTVKVYKKTGNNYVYKARINGLAAGDQYGKCALSDDGTKIIVSSALKDDVFVDAGQARVFDLTSVLTTDTFVNSKINSYPNPTKDYVSFTINDSDFEAKINVYNHLGQLIKTCNETSKIDISGFSNGVYMFEINAAETKQVIKIIKI